MSIANKHKIEGLIQQPYNASVRVMLASLERNVLPDAIIRSLTRLLLAARLRSAYKPSSELQLSDLLNFVHSLKEMPIAIKTEEPKAQHYELSTSFFKLVLGKNLNCCYFSDESNTLEDAEKAMLELYCERAQPKDGHTVLDIGCGWGSLSLYIAQKYCNYRINGICNSKTQKAFIEEQCRERQLQNVEIIVADISTFEMEGSYDRIFSVEMFEDKNDDDWITRYFFTGGTMPAANLLLYFWDDVSVVNQWLVNGKHYAQTSEEWLKRMDKNSALIKPIMESTYGKDQALKWTVYWRTFFVSVAELFGYNNGEEWMVAHFLFKKK
ncbi:(S)-coclaurine N-methyltransferase-like isoform X2 [Hevea brasiliensis]|uniref:(S)-coclaurine N-methyltransferase-like isoform X2 n=1 Tax=Hevea brasiliensis TaxID=3981 RepID=UPI002600FB39|nr:(S)-coclaurine N-methyltransferase-like isoform X2 [Hevea brasiliensis]